MHIVNDAAAFDAVADTDLRAILERYAEMMELATIYIIEPGDTLEALQAKRGWPLEDWEFIHHHASGWLEAVFIISDDGTGHVVLAHDNAETDQALLMCMIAGAVPADQPEGSIG
jgi:hypothetical protein